jgi:hypothetical protein
MEQEILFYIEFYKKIFSKAHYYKLVDKFIKLKSIVSNRQIIICKYDPIFQIIKTNNKVDIFSKIYESYSHGIWIHYKNFVKLSNIFCKEYVYLKLMDNQGYVINYKKLDELIHE